MPQLPLADPAAGRLVRLRAFFTPYVADEQDAAQFRARQLQAVLQLTPIAMFVNVANAALMCAALWHQASRGFLVAWAAIVVCLAALGFRGWYRAWRRPPRATASRRATHRATLQATVLGMVWAALPVATFAVATSSGRFLIGMVTTGMICAGGCMLAPIPWASTAFTLALGAGAAYALGTWQALEAASVTTLLVFYVATVVYAAWTLAKTLGARLQAEAHAARQSEVIGLLLRDVEDQSSDLLWELDAAGRFAKVSHRMAEAMGTDATRLQGLRASTLLQRLLPRDEEAAALWTVLRQRLARQAPFRDTVVHLASNGRQRWWSVSARPLMDASSRPSGWRGVATDITDKHVAHRRLKWLAHNDALTGLANRAQFHEHLRTALPAPPGQIGPFALVAFDLDGFKQTNDSHGHQAGDCLLQAFSARLRGVARRSDLVARLGGDEFAMVVHGVSTQAEILPLLERIIASLRDPLLTNGVRISLRASMGVAFAPQDGQDVDALMNHADIALYAAKRAGGSRYHFFQPAMADATRRRVALEHSLRDVVQRQELHLVYQPQVSAIDRGLCGFEALLRWSHPEFGDVPPTEFIGIAERSGLMPAIGTWVLAQACREAQGWPEHLTISVNVSATQLTAQGFVESVRSASGLLPAQRVELEITESALMDDADTAVAVLTTLRGMGYRIALDDFGTGYSALGYLRLFRFDTLKIDKSFVRDLAANAEAQVIVDTILAMAGALKMATVAEGVETCEEAQLLEQRGCRVLQGYLIGRPMPPAAARTFIANRVGSREPLACVGLPSGGTQENGAVRCEN